MEKLVPGFGILLLLAICPRVVRMDGGFNQKATLYSGNGATGDWVTLIETYSPDLSYHNFVRRANSTCVQGIWLFYEKLGYGYVSSLTEWVFGPAGTCTDFQNLTGSQRPQSVRFAGSLNDYRKDTITLYEYLYFRGDELYTESALNKTTFQPYIYSPSSFIVTGQSPWTLYEEYNFGGGSMCVQPPPSANYTPAFIFDAGAVKFPIKSVKIGCTSSLFL